MYTKSLSIFEPLTYLARLNIQFYLSDKTFPISQLSNCFRKPITTWVAYRFVKNDFVLTQVSSKTFVIKELANPGTLFIYVLTITDRNLIEVVR